MTETAAASTRVPVSIQLIGGPAVLLEIGGLRLLTDQAFDAPGPVPSGDRTLTRTTVPAVAAEEAPTGWGASSPATTGCGLSPPESASRSDPVH